VGQVSPFTQVHENSPSSACPRAVPPSSSGTERVLSRRAPTRATKGISVDEKGALCAYFFGWNLPPSRTLVAHKQKAHGGGKDGGHTHISHPQLEVPDVVHEGTCRCVRGSQLIMADYSPTGVGSWETEGVWGDVTSVCWPVATDEELHAARDIWLNQVRGNVCVSVHTNTKLRAAAMECQHTRATTASSGIFGICCMVAKHWPCGPAAGVLTRCWHRVAIVAMIANRLSLLPEPQHARSSE
jgi:hypothetical protein